jgi:spore maturation protein CgeB
MQIVILGLSITSSWGNGHATTYRALVGALAARGHNIVFLERDVAWYADNRDLSQPWGCQTFLYSSLADLKNRFRSIVSQADLVIVGSYVPEGVAVGRWVIRCASGVTAFYDIDTPVTLSKLRRDDEEYLTRDLVASYDLYLSFTGGPTLERLEKRYGSPCARVLYCSADPEKYSPEDLPRRWSMGYLGTYSQDRQPKVERLSNQVARAMPGHSFVVAGPLYPRGIAWSVNVDRIEHLAPNGHSRFYNSQAWTLNVTRADMIEAGWSPSVRLFEAGACGVPVISDAWPGLDEIFRIGEEIQIARNTDDVVRIISRTPEADRLAMGVRFRHRVLAEHTSCKRAEQLEGYVMERSRSMTGVLSQRR